MEASEDVDSRQRRFADEARRRARGRGHRADRRGQRQRRRRARRAAQGVGDGRRRTWLRRGPAGYRLPRGCGEPVAPCAPVRLRRLPAGVGGGAWLRARGASRGATPAPRITLPLGLPWIGAHFRLDALSAFFLAVVNLGAAAASLFALGYGRHEEAPERVLPFYAAFLAGMNLVVLADDAFTFLVSWEFMSLSSCALVMAHHREPENVRAGYIYLVMASIGTLALLLAFGALAGAEGGYAFETIRAAPPSAQVAALRVLPGAVRRGIQGRSRAAACLAAARASGSAEPRLGADERRDDQGRGLRLHPHRVRSARTAGRGGGAWSCSASAAPPR